MSLYENLARIERGQRLILDEIQKAKQEAKDLEMENQRLRRQLCRFGDGDDQQVEANGLQIRQTAQDNLEALYMEGFHVCHLFFGRERDGECLFCRGLLGQ